MTVSRPESKIIVFDTDTYAMHFHQDMCAHVTGQVGETKAGAGVAWEAVEDIQHLPWFDAHIVQVEDDDERETPVSVWPTPGRFHDGGIGHHDDTPEVRATLDGARATSTLPAEESVAIFVDEFPPDDVLTEMLERAKTFCVEHRIKYLSCRFLEPTYGVEEVKVVVAHQEVRRS